LDTADTSSKPSILSGDVDVTSISPSWSPRVSDDVVGLSVLNSVSDSSDSVIEGGSASGGVQDSTSVTLEDFGVSFNSNRDWSLVDGSEEGAGRPSFDGIDLGDEGDWGSFLLAGSRSTST